MKLTLKTLQGCTDHSTVKKQHFYVILLYGTTTKQKNFQSVSIYKRDLSSALPQTQLLISWQIPAFIKHLHHVNNKIIILMVFRIFAAESENISESLTYGCCCRFESRVREEISLFKVKYCIFDLIST